MRLSDFTTWVAARPELADALCDDSPSVLWEQVCPEARPLLVAAADRRSPRKALVVTANYERALQWVARLCLCGIEPARVRLLPSGQSVLFEDSAPESVALSDRLGALGALAGADAAIVVATAPAALERTLPAEALTVAGLSVRVGDTMPLDRAAVTLLGLGYEPADPVRVPGQFARRGGILDVFPMGYERPVRIDLFGDEVESLRSFDPMSQRSLGPLDRLDVSLSRETLLPSPASGVVELVRLTLDREEARLGGEAGERLRELVSADLDALDRRVFFDRLDLYRPIVHPDSGCAVDLLGGEGLLILDEPFELEAVAARAEEELGQALAHRAERGEMLASTALDFMLPPEHFGRAGRCLCLSAGTGWARWLPPGPAHDLEARSLEPYRTQPAVLTKTLAGWLEQGVRVGLSTDQPTRAKAMLGQVDVFAVDLEPGTQPDAPGVYTLEGNLAGGFVLPQARVALVTDHELFGVGRLKLPQRKFSEGIPITTVLDLKPGDYVVHITFGIGVFRGLVRRIQDGVEKEFLHIDYKAPDRLFVPADQLDRVQKYLAPDDVPPKVNRLTGGEWQKTVGKARAEAREYARELIRLYAERKRVERPSYGPDSPWQAEMEHTFPWVETPSQLQAIEEVKADLQTDYPMDRLVCGDVGFGKTEVAIRAAFKVAQAGRQVAVLCPTTILSEQHYRNFSERLAGFPTRLALLNRFGTGAGRAAVKRGLADGSIDVVVGTHALLSEDLRFRRLGLLIVDEEQKFGVKHKEALKALRVSVDVLTLSATPIPRTLSMALMNVRQMSLINDPPPGRLPIRTFVRPFSTEVVREALLRELARGGQVYYVSNRVGGIDHVAERIRRLVPTARVAVGHGQMHLRELEPVMMGFVKGEVDVLVSTTIVESGLDIPNANTLIVENADRFGLAQLYQLRGRVGRSDRQAYAYFLHTGVKELTENAAARLRALQEFSQLGSGYSLAFRDLQIRGAGELLGARQSGQMSAVGFDLYTQLIESEAEFLKRFADGEAPAGPSDPLAGLDPLPTVDLPIRALIPAAYIEDEGQRLYYYRLLMSSRDHDSLAAFRAEVEDRYGRAPVEVETAIRVMHLRLDARTLQIEKVDGREGRLAATFRPNHDLSPRVFTIACQRRREAFLAHDAFVWPYTGSPVEACEAMLEALRGAVRAVEEQRAALGLA